MENFTNGYTANRLSDITLYRPQARKSLWMLSRSLLIGLWISLGWLGTIQAQTNLGGVINTYAPVTAVSGNDITIGNRVGATHTFAIGGIVVIAQMTGNTNANAGHYDMRRIIGIKGSTITVDGTSVAGRYSPTTEKVQLVYVPYDEVGFTVTSTVTPLVWNGMIGGIIAVFTPGTLTMNNSINASCAGFRVADSTALLKGSDIYWGGGSSGAYWGGGGAGGSYGIGGFYGGSSNQGADVAVQGIGTYNGGALNFNAPDVMSNGGGGGGAGAGGAGGGGGGNVGGGGGGGGASPSQAGCGGLGNGLGGAGSINGTGGTNGTGSGGRSASSGGGGGGKFAAGGGGASAGSGGLAGVNGGMGGNGSTVVLGGGEYIYGAGGGGAGGNGGIGFVTNSNMTYRAIGGAAYKLSPSGYTNFLNTTNPRIQMGGAGNGLNFFGVNGGGIVLLKANTIIGNNNNISANGCTGKGVVGVFISANAGGGGGGNIILDVNAYTTALDVQAKGGNGADAVVTSTDGVYVSGTGGGGGGGGIWISNSTTSNNLNTTLTPPTVSNVSFNIQAGLGGAGAANTKAGGVSGGGGCGGGGIVYASPFILITPCNANKTPTLSATTKSNVCPTSTVDLNSLVTSTCPIGSVLEWHTTNTNLSAANQVSNSTNAGAGTYYAACVDQSNNCYSQTTTGVTVTIKTCTDLTIVKSGPTTVTTNGILSYTLLIKNNGPVSADSSTITDANAANFTVSSVVCTAISGGASCPTLANLTTANLQSGMVVIPALPNGGSVTLTVTGTAGGSGTITNTALVTPAIGIGGDSTPANNTSTATTTIAKTCAAIPTPLVK